jgi:Ca2+-binding RTX toxin-like protein/mannose/cellobiose epimerase-like protein (N-acyl-D-glucosamine 2-epimerase family)
MSARPNRPARGLVAEPLERRTLLALATMSAGVLEVNGTAGNDTIAITVGSAQVHVVVNAAAEDWAVGGINSLRVNGLGGNDGITVTATSKPASLSGGDGNDSLTSGGGNDTLVGGAGDDLLNGGTGADRLSGGVGGGDIADYQSRTAALTVTIGDALQGDGAAGENDDVQADVERVYGGSGNDRLVGTPGPNLLRGYGGNDTLIGGDWSDTLVGGSGNDRLEGGNSNDLLQGDSGADLFIGGAGDRDTADYTIQTVALKVSLNGVADDGATGEGDNVQSDVEKVIGGSGNDLILGSNIANTLYGGKGLDTIFGYGGIDTIYGGSHSDRIDAGSSNDKVYGESGNDVLRGGSGRDTIYGDTGNDWFYTREGEVDELFGGGGNETAAEVDDIDILHDIVRPGLFDLHVNAAEVRGLLIGDVHRINGGLLRDGVGNIVYSSGRAVPDTRTRSSSDPNAAFGLGSYQTGFDGFFHSAQLTRTFDVGKNEWWGGGWRDTPISQSRAIYINTVAARYAPTTGEAGQFKNAATLGSQFLNRVLNPGASSYGFRDPVNGGFYWGITPPEVSGQAAYGTYSKQDGGKSAYGQVHPVFALANAYTATGDVGFLNAALAGWDSFRAHYRDTGYAGPYAAGAYLPDQNENFSALTDTRNLDYMCHTFETAYILWQAMPDGHARKAELRTRTQELGDFITNVMVKPMVGDSTRAYIPWRYASNWTPVAGGTMSVGHNFEYAFLLNRAFEHGVGSQGWVDAADKLVNFAAAYGTAWKGSQSQYYVINNGDLNYNGTDPDASQDVGWWQQVEMTRALAHYVFTRGKNELLDEFDGAWRTYREKLIDQTYGGTWQGLNPTTLAGVTGDWLKEAKVWEWKVYYHESMMYDELLRLDAVSPAATLAAAPAASLAAPKVVQADLTVLSQGVRLAPRASASIGDVQADDDELLPA